MRYQFDRNACRNAGGKFIVCQVETRHIAFMAEKYISCDKYMAILYKKDG